jgi:hypothetical protein
MLLSRCPRWGTQRTEPVSRGSVRHGLGRAGRFGRRVENSFRVFGFLAPNPALHCVENLRVDGSIPFLATISNFLILMSFRASPADY